MMQLVVQLALETTFWSLGIVVLVVDLEDEGGVHVLGWGRDHDLLGAALDVGRGLLAVGEDAGRLDDYVGANVAPGDLGGVSLGEGLDLAVADAKDVAVELHVLGPDAVRRVALEQQREAIHRHQIVYGNDLDVVIAALYRRLGGEHARSDRNRLFPPLRPLVLLSLGFQRSLSLYPKAEKLTRFWVPCLRDQR